MDANIGLNLGPKRLWRNIAIIGYKEHKCNGWVKLYKMCLEIRLHIDIANSGPRSFTWQTAAAYAQSSFMHHSVALTSGVNKCFISWSSFLFLHTRFLFSFSMHFLNMMLVPIWKLCLTTTTTKNFWKTNFSFASSVDCANVSEPGEFTQNNQSR